MSKIDDGGPAFPWHSDGCVPDIEPSLGMSLRDWFAGQALAGIYANSAGTDLGKGALAEEMYSIADAMLAARKETTR